MSDYRLIPLFMTGGLILISFALMVARCSSYAWKYATGGEKEEEYLNIQRYLALAIGASFIGFLVAGPYLAAAMSCAVAAILVIFPVHRLVGMDEDDTDPICGKPVKRWHMYVLATAGAAFVTFMIASALLGNLRHFTAAA